MRCGPGHKGLVSGLPAAVDGDRPAQNRHRLHLLEARFFNHARESGHVGEAAGGGLGGAAIEGMITTASGEVHPVKYDYYSPSLADVRGYSTWQDARTTYDRLARNLAAGRYVSR